MNAVSSYDMRKYAAEQMNKNTVGVLNLILK